MAITLTDRGHLVGLGPDERVWDAAARATHDLAWDPAAPLLAVVGGSILVDGSGTARAHADGADLDLSSTGHLLAAHLDGVVDVHEPSGTIVQTAPAARVLWRPGTDELLVADRERARRIGAAGETELLADDGRGELLIAVSPGGELLAVHGQTGPIELVDESGQQLASFPAHGRLNLAAAIGTTLLATSGADGNVMLYDLVRRGLHVALTLDALVVRLEFDPTERFVAATTASDEVHVIECQTGEPIGTTAPATWGRWHPTTPCLACCGDRALWLEDYS